MDIDIIEDDTALRELYKEIIEISGLKVNSYACAEDYITYTKSKSYSSPNIAIITDVRMPGKSGCELIDDVKNNNPKQKFVVMTGTPQDAGIKDTKACFYVEKPVNMDKLLEVSKLLSSCTIDGNYDLAPACKLISDLDSFGIHDWKCPNR